MMNSTVIRVPLITGFPTITLESAEIRPCQFIPTSPDKGRPQISAYTIIGGPAIDITTPAF
tara:strand:+ start:242 stop:424 length:183 start_codon:yes stop_codon:yes gene_type:complete